jgi:hypothetical protein
VCPDVATRYPVAQERTAAVGDQQVNTLTLNEPLEVDAGVVVVNATRVRHAALEQLGPDLLDLFPCFID